jgi:hypothetical protein
MGRRLTRGGKAKRRGQTARRRGQTDQLIDEAPALLAAVEQGTPVAELAAVRAGQFRPARTAMAARPR